MREDTTFTVSGLALSGWIYTPDQGQGPYPVIVMSHGFGAIKEMSLDQTAEIFCQAGYVVVVYRDWSAVSPLSPVSRSILRSAACRAFSKSPCSAG